MNSLCHKLYHSMHHRKITAILEKTLQKDDHL